MCWDKNPQIISPDVWDPQAWRSIKAQARIMWSQWVLFAASPAVFVLHKQRERISPAMAMDQKVVAGAGGAGIVFLAVVFLAIVSSRGGDQQLEEIQFLRR